MGTQLHAQIHIYICVCMGMACVQIQRVIKFSRKAAVTEIIYPAILNADKKSHPQSHLIFQIPIPYLKEIICSTYVSITFGFSFVIMNCTVTRHGFWSCSGSINHFLNCQGFHIHHLITFDMHYTKFGSSWLYTYWVLYQRLISGYLRYPATCSILMSIPFENKNSLLIEFTNRIHKRELSYPQN